MKIINGYEKFNEGKTNPYKLTYSLAGEAWNEIWKNGIYKWKPSNSHIIIKLKHDNENDIGLIEVFVYNTLDVYGGYESVGTKYFRPIDEERNNFFNWLNELNLIIK